MKLVPVDNTGRPLWCIHCGQPRAEGGRCWHDAVVVDIDAPAYSIEAYYCEEHRPDKPASLQSST